MQTFRIQKPKPRKSSKPVRSWNDRRNEIADSIESDPDNAAMVACTECVNHNVVCYYDREQSVKCAACLRHQRNCDGTFSMEEFRKVGEQKKRLREKSRQKRKDIRRTRERRVLAHGAFLEAQLALARADADLLAEEAADEKFNDDLAALEDASDRMLKREMQALGVFAEISADRGVDHEVALASPDFV